MALPSLTRRQGTATSTRRTLASAVIRFLILACCVDLFAVASLASARGQAYTPTIKGAVVASRLAGIEPDGDPLDQVVLQTKLSAATGVPPVNLIVSAYLENFQPDTTPILPDLLNPKRTAQNLGGFLQGKALLTDDAGNVLYIGAFLTEAFLDNSNHAVLSLDGGGAAQGGTASLKGWFLLHSGGSLTGSLTGHISLPQAARRQLLRHHGMRMKPIKQIINTVTVRPHPMMGKATKGSSNAPLHTGFASPSRFKSAAPTSPPHSISIWTFVTGLGAVISFLVAAVLFWSARRQPAQPLRDEAR